MAEKNTKNQKRIKSILEGPILKSLIVLSAPITFAFLMNTLFQVVDLIFVAKLGEEHIAAMSLIMVVTHLIYAICIGPAIGITSLVARKIGAGNFEKANVIASHGITIIMIITFLITASGLLFGKDLLRALGGEGRVLTLSWEYMNIRFVTVFFVVARIIFAGVLRGEGDMRMDMNVLLFATVINIVLDPIFIFGFAFIPKMGIMGASLATAISDVIACLWLTLYVFRQKNVIKINFKKFHFSLSAFFKIFKVGFPVSIQHLSMVIAFGVIARLVAGYGDNALAAAGIGMRLEIFVIIPIVGLSTGMLTMAGQNYGAKNYLRVKQTTYRGVLINTSFGLLFGIVFIVFPEFFIKIFTDNKLIIKEGKHFLVISGIALWTSGIGIGLANVFQGLGKGLISMILTITRVGLIGVPAALIMASFWGLNGIWYGMALGRVISAGFGIFIFVYFINKKLLSNNNVEPEIFDEEIIDANTV